ncbi:MAG: mechanosensitive ion channel [Thermostichus sp. DG02_5_bins_236]
MEWLQGLEISQGWAQVGVITLVGLLAFGLGRWIPQWLKPTVKKLASPDVAEVYERTVDPYAGLIGLVVTLLLAEVVLLVLPRGLWLHLTELGVSLALTIALVWLLTRLVKGFADVYLRDTALKGGRKVNSELLIVGRISANLAIGFLALLLFAQGHQINVVGLFASLGIGGLAVAFAAQKTLEQLLGGIVIYVDRPFVVDDYIGLPDGTFGRVESIGLRSTRIRTSGKGTLVIVPNSALTQVSIENFTGAKKVMSLIYLTFQRLLPDEEKALIRQVILESTRDIFGIDSRNTDLTFRELNAQGSQPARSQAQLTFFILGSGEVSMDLRRQLLDLANETITQRLKEYRIAFEIQDPTIYVDAPITI